MVWCGVVWCVQSCPFFQGSPRDLALNSNISILKSRLKEISGCTLQFKLYSQRKLLKAQRLIAENEAIGRCVRVCDVTSLSFSFSDSLKRVIEVIAVYQLRYRAVNRAGVDKIRGMGCKRRREELEEVEMRTEGSTS